ncbi:phytoene/squalene synthase family protein [Brevibacterium samyangense]|uniref:Squalene/phytoene synthase family protein n=1 Tax=Brevibacterium samyangense TaxID=366888 RepID=A0ABN2TJM7_9MICO
MTSEAEWNRTAYAAAAQVLHQYSTSFSLAARTLPRRVRMHIAAIYAVVRVADEIVDGAWPTASPEATAEALHDYRHRVARAVDAGFSTDPCVHAFALTARATGIGPAHWDPFFASMLEDVDPQPHDRESLSRYVHGSAEVVGEMCVLAFFDGDFDPVRAEVRARIVAGAHALGSAFQKVNFLRDLGVDSAVLERTYLGADITPGSATDPTVTGSTVTGSTGGFSDDTKTAFVAEIAAELDLAASTIDLLPAGVRPAVRTAHGIFAELNARIGRTPAHELLTRRVRVPDARKLLIAGRAFSGRAVSGRASTGARA